jgi:hypothetical protein
VKIAGILGATTLSLAMSAPVTQPAHPSDQFVTVNGVRLHTLDWGGTGDVLLFLAGLGDSVHRFDAFAPKFVDHYHAIGFTRRGQEESGKADTYDLRGLAEDIRAFLDNKQIRRATLVGHSIAGAEMTLFAGLHPDRVTALIYLDAAYDYARAYELAVAGGLASVNPDQALEAISIASRVHPDYSKVTCPALAFFVLYDAPVVTPEMDEATKRGRELAFKVLDTGYKRDQVNLFKTTVKRGRVVEWHDTNHMFFDDPRHSDETARIIQTFLVR